MENKRYLCIDLKTFYASCECVERGLDPFKVNLVVADPSRGKGAICLAISPKLKAQGIKNRCRLYEIPENIDYIIAKPRMKKYMEYSAQIYGIYLKYISSQDIHVYSIDECFLDVTPYLHLYKLSPKELAKKIIDDVKQTTGITAACGIGTNLYLTKIALDISAKHTKDNLAFLDEEIFKATLWHHQPLTDFWHIGKGISNHLNKLGIKDMYDLAHYPEDILYKEFGINAEYLIDHAWGQEPTTIQDIKNYKPKTNSISNSQILFEDYDYEHALLILKEMVEVTILRLSDMHLVTNHISLYIGYTKNVHKASRGSCKITCTTNSCSILTNEFIDLFKKITNPIYQIRQIGISFGNLQNEIYEQYDLFNNYENIVEEKNLQHTISTIKNRYGKNAIFKGMNLLPKATTIKRNKLIGGHNAQ